MDSKGKGINKSGPSSRPRVFARRDFPPAVREELHRQFPQHYSPLPEDAYFSSSESEPMEYNDAASTTPSRSRTRSMSPPLPRIEPSDGPVRRPTPVMGARPGASMSFRMPRSGPLYPTMGEPDLVQPARHSVHLGHSARHGMDMAGPSRSRAVDVNPQREENYMLWSAMFEQEKKATQLAEQFQRHIGAVTLQLEMTRKELKETREARQATKKKGFFATVWDSLRGKKT
ncbi:hypothetical protein E3N88_10079 [Mikania micrantha]|uniref:Uncharacterized protein n=1 Tax=Mikania micrantha TaxID=192012 RepID=A0A5N6PAP5_9ASTR|nr:hypothetical protein E3N88_10079 [Mikania micrantha]